MYCPFYTSLFVFSLFFFLPYIFSVLLILFLFLFQFHFVPSLFVISASFFCPSSFLHTLFSHHCYYYYSFFKLLFCQSNFHYLLFNVPLLRFFPSSSRLFFNIYIIFTLPSVLTLIKNTYTHKYTHTHIHTHNLEIHKRLYNIQRKGRGITI